MKIVEYILIGKFRMDKLKLLHERVKSHPYRINRDEEYLNSYQNLLYNLADAFYDVIKETEYKKLYTAPLKTFLEKGTEVDFGHGIQLVLNKESFAVVPF